MIGSIVSQLVCVVIGPKNLLKMVPFSFIFGLVFGSLLKYWLTSQMFIPMTCQYCEFLLEKFELLMMKMMFYAGEKISPIEVDAVLLSHPDIAQGVAFGVPDDKYGEEVKESFHSHL